MIDYLSSVYKTRVVPLIYMASKENIGDVADTTREEETLYHDSLN